MLSIENDSIFKLVWEMILVNSFSCLKKNVSSFEINCGDWSYNAIQAQPVSFFFTSSLLTYQIQVKTFNNKTDK